MDKKGSTLRLDAPHGSVTMSYRLARQGWVSIVKSIPPGSLSGTRAIEFSYAGMGAPNTLEFKLHYTGGKPTFGWFWHRASQTRGKRHRVEIPYAKFLCWRTTGCSDGEAVNVARVQSIDLAVSNKSSAGDVPGRGSVSFGKVTAARRG